MGEVVDFADERQFRALLTTLPGRRSEVGDLAVLKTHGGWSMYPIADHLPDGSVRRVFVQSGVRVPIAGLSRPQYFIVPAKVFGDELRARAVCWIFYPDLESLIRACSAHIRGRA